MRPFCILTLLVTSLLALTAGYSSCRLNTVAKANRLFGVDLYKKISGASGARSIILSPFSVSAALAMTYAGARGRTSSQMSQVLHFNGLRCNVHSCFRMLLRHMCASTNGHVLKVANRIFVDQRFRLLRSFVRVTKYDYRATAKKLCFSRNPHLARRNINRWVSTQTNGKISNLLPPGSISRNTVLSLVNAITFKGDWEHRFTTGETLTERFYQSTTKYVDMMRMSHGAPYFNYADVSSIKAEVVELPYRNSQMAMYVVLPYSSSSISSLEQVFEWNPNSLNLSARRMIIKLPRFGVRSKVNMGSQLRKLGMWDLFGHADLRGINGRNNLFVGDVFHEAYIKVSEKGTDAGAATASIHGKSFLRSFGNTFTANRPFLFFIWDNDTNSLLFSGRFCG